MEHRLPPLPHEHAEAIGAEDLPVGEQDANVEDAELLIDLHRSAARQGPGGATETMKALGLASLDASQSLRIADIGCGTGASTLVLAEEVDASITAVDLFPEFLDELRSRALNHRVADRITTLACSMDALPFSDGAFDVIWSEGAVYSMGFEAGVSYWRRFLKPEGVIAVSELTWLTVTRPRDLEAYWAKEYPEIDTASSKIGILERHGYTPEAYFVLPRHCWLENYYQPMRGRFVEFLERHERSEQARAIVHAEENEIALFERYSTHFGYGFYVAKKTGA